MRLDRVVIDDFKNLRNLAIDFDETSPYCVLVGENGAGKSNLLEGIAHIFRSLDLDVPAPFGYELKYQCRGTSVTVRAPRDAPPEYELRARDESESRSVTKAAFMAEDDEGRPRFRPAFVFGYYSGPGDRLGDLFERHRERYYAAIIRAPELRKRRPGPDPASLRRLFYAQTLHGQFALLAFFMAGENEAAADRAFLEEHLQIADLDCVLFALRRPPWRGRGGDERFWNAEGEVREFLSRVYDAALLPLRMNRRIPVDLAKNPNVESLYLFLDGRDALRQVYESYQNQYAFFTALESTHLSKLLGEVRTRVRMTSRAGGGDVTYRDLSEGEQQLLLVLGLIKFTSRDEALFLLDEPDTHLNPVWSTQYLDFLDHFIGRRERRDTCHILMSSHDPLVFSRLARDQVRIVRRDESGAAVVEVPDRDPKGMGVAAILTSDLFRLRTTLDSESQELLDRQRVLSSADALTAAESAELLTINSVLRDLGLHQTVRDPLYEEFVRAWTAREDPAWREVVDLSPEQREQRRKLAEEIVDQLRSEPPTA